MVSVLFVQAKAEPKPMILDVNSSAQAPIGTFSETQGRSQASVADPDSVTLNQSPVGSQLIWWKGTLKLTVMGVPLVAEVQGIEPGQVGVTVPIVILAPANTRFTATCTSLAAALGTTAARHPSRAAVVSSWQVMPN
jgi:hypothetical protein